MKNIVFYVHRTGLLGYFVEPICSYLSNEYNITILHLDKKNNYHSNDFNLFNKIDISDYSITDIRELLKRLSPVAVINL